MSPELKRFQWLAQALKRHHFTIGAELGCKIGRTTSYLLKRVPDLQLIAVDTWARMPELSNEYDSWDHEAMYRRFLGNTRSHKARLRVLRMRTNEACHHVDDGSLDFVFIDADHSYESVKEDINLWEPKVRPGGMVAGHDTHFPGVYKAITERYASGMLRMVRHDHCWFVMVPSL